MQEDEVTSVVKRFYYSLGTMFIIIAVLILAILVFVSFGRGPSWPRGVTGVLLTLIALLMVWLSLGDKMKSGQPGLAYFPE